MMKRPLILSVLLLTGLSAVVQAAENRPSQPNILVILTDDVGWGDYGCYNPNSKIPTPNIDRLAREGMRFSNAHTPAALCAPTRYAMLTGNYPWRGRAPGGTWGYNVPSQLKPGQQTVAKLLQTAGYRTAMFGKAGTGGFWASSPDEKRNEPLAPSEWGFDYSFLIPRGHQSPPYAFFENGVAVKMDWVVSEVKMDWEVSKFGERLLVKMDWENSKVGERLLGKAVDFLDYIARGRERPPFYLHFCTDGAHSPYVPAASLAGTPLKGVTKMTDHTDMVHQTDILTGALVEALEKRGLLTNTLVIVTSDNGGLPYERNYGHDAVGGLRGRKGFIFEGGHRVPFIARWAGKIPAGTVRNQVVGIHDMVATALDLAGVKIDDQQCLDAISLVPVLLGTRDDKTPIRIDLLVQSSPGRDADDDGGFSSVDIEINQAEGVKASHKAAAKKRLAKHAVSDHMAHALIEGDWKLVFAMTDQPAALYNLADDLAEKKNQLNDPAQAERVKRMTQRYRDIRNSKRSTPSAL